MASLDSSDRSLDLGAPGEHVLLVGGDRGGVLQPPLGGWDLGLWLRASLRESVVRDRAAVSSSASMTGSASRSSDRRDCSLGFVE